MSCCNHNCNQGRNCPKRKTDTAAPAVEEGNEMSGDHNLYGEGAVYHGVRSSDSNVQTYSVQELAHAKGVPGMVTSAMLALETKLVEALEKLHVLECVANRLSIDLECMTLDPQNAHWHDKANQSLQAYRDLMDQWYPQEFNKTINSNSCAPW